MLPYLGSPAGSCSSEPVPGAIATVSCRELLCVFVAAGISGECAARPIGLRGFISATPIARQLGIPSTGYVDFSGAVRTFLGQVVAANLEVVLSFASSTAGDGITNDHEASEQCG